MRAARPAGDIPFLKPGDLGSVTAERRRARFSVALGVNGLANGAIQALAVAKAAGADFIRVNQWANP